MCNLPKKLSRILPNHNVEIYYMKHQSLGVKSKRSMILFLKWMESRSYIIRKWTSKDIMYVLRQN